MLIPDAPGDGTPGPDMVDDGQARVSVMRGVEGPRPGTCVILKCAADSAQCRRARGDDDNGSG